MEELIICVASCPGENQTEKFPGKMDVTEEIIPSHGAGASIAHMHVRDESGRQTTDTTLFRSQIEEIHTACPMIIEGSTGGTPEHSLAERCISISIPGTEMGSLNLGSINMPGGVYQNPMSDSQKILNIFLEQLPEKSVWFLARHHAPGWRGFRDALERGGHVRVGYEDGPFLLTGKRASSNAEFVEEVVHAAEATGRKVVGPQRAREILGIVS